jgi:archaellum component FlaC
MKKEYKEVYNLVNNLNYNCDYIKFKYGIYSLNLFSKDYNCLGNGRRIYISSVNLQELKQQIKEVLK